MTTYCINLSSGNIRNSQDEIKKCEKAMTKYYTDHRLVSSVDLIGKEAAEGGYYTIKIDVKLSPVVASL